MLTSAYRNGLEDLIISARPTLPELHRLARRSGIDVHALPAGMGIPASVNELVSLVRSPQALTAFLVELPVVLPHIRAEAVSALATELLAQPSDSAPIADGEVRIAMQRYPLILHPHRQDHFAATVSNLIHLNELLGAVSESQAYLLAATGSSRLGVWGFRRTSEARRAFSMLRPGDVLAFYDPESRVVWGTATIVLPFESTSVSNRLIELGRWEAYNGEGYPLLMALHDVRTGLSVPLEALRGVLPGYSGKGAPSLVTAVPGSLSARLLRILDSVGARRPLASEDEARAFLGSREARPGVLVVATEWESTNGGISTFNRGLCLALARAGAQVECLIHESNPDSEAVDRPLHGTTSAEHPVAITRIRVDRATHDTLTAYRHAVSVFHSSKLSRVDVIIGHGHITGSAARELRDLHYPEASLVHVVHTDPERVAAFKAGAPTSENEMRRGAEKMKVELANCKNADVICAVGPKLVAAAQRWVHSLPREGKLFPMPDQVVELLPGVDNSAAQLIVPLHAQILTIGRLDDPTKGFDLFQKVVAEVGDRLDTQLRWVIRGIPDERADEAQVTALAASLNAIVRPYSSDAADIDIDLRGSTVVCMVSREEGFGLVAFEAAIRGIPVLVPSDSGFAGLITRLDRNDPAVVEQVRSDEELVTAWSRKLARLLRDTTSAFDDAAARLGRLLRPEAECDWDVTARKLLSAVEAIAANRSWPPIAP